jgi:beta-glucanase (GH16 family)
LGTSTKYNARLKSSIKPLLLIAITLFVLSCGEDNGAESNWELVWEDNFEGVAGERIDDAKWNYDIGTDWGNNQLEYDTDKTENVSLDGDGNLAITAIKENFSGAAYTSGRITTKGKFEQVYGRFEAKIKMPFGQGIWPAFWMLGADIDAVSWPQCGEIDIVEFRGQEPTIIHGSVHGPGYFGGNPVTETFQFTNDRFDNGFHVFAVEWFEDRIDFFVDETLYQRIKITDVPGEWVFDDPFFMILNLAVGGNFVGSPNSNTRFPQTMLIDWVRVYKAIN